MNFIIKGAPDGHEFYGNQHTDGSGGGQDSDVVTIQRDTSGGESSSTIKDPAAVSRIRRIAERVDIEVIDAEDKIRKASLLTIGERRKLGPAVDAHMSKLENMAAQWDKASEIDSARSDVYKEQKRRMVAALEKLRVVKDRIENEKGKTMRFSRLNRKSEDEGVEESEPQEIPCQKCGVMFKAVDGATMCAGCVAPVEGKKHVDLVAKRFTASSSMERKNVTGYREVKDAAGDVVDYKDVAISGYLTTWKETTPKDRDGEYVIKGALGKSIAKFMENPVLLRDHKNLTENVAGSVTSLVEDERGVAFKAVLSNKPEMRGLRFDVVEGHIKAVSMGGAFLYDNRDSKGIKEVALFETTICPIPANQDALFTVSDLPAVERKFLEDGGTLDGLKAFHYKNVIDTEAS